MRFAQGIQWARGVLAVLVLASYWFQYRLLRQAQLGELISEEVAAANDWRVRVLGGIQTVVVIIAVIAFVQWFYRAYQNVHRLPDAKPDHRPDTAIWSWLIPVVNLWLPYKILKEIGHYTGRFSRLQEESLSSRWDNLAIIWLVVHFGLVIFSRVRWSTTDDIASITDLIQGTQQSMAIQVATLVSVGVTLALLRTIAPFENDLLARGTAPPTVTSPDTGTTLTLQ